MKFRPRSENGKPVDTEQKFIVFFSLSPECIENCSFKPQYTEEAAKLKIQGNVLVAFKVHTDGTTGDFRIVKGLGHGLDEIAIGGVAKMKFRPSTVGGRTVDIDQQYEVHFQLTQ